MATTRNPSTITAYQAKGRYQQIEVAAAYDAERFRSWLGRAAHRREMAALGRVLDGYQVGDGTVLDIPCGTARMFEAYAGRGLRVTGADLSKNMLAQAQARFGDIPDFDFTVADAETLPFADDSFDYAVSFRLMCHLPPRVRRRVLSEMIRVARRLLLINYHFNVRSPLLWISRLLRRGSAMLPFPMVPSDIAFDLENQPVHVCEIQRLAWYEPSAAIVVLRKNGALPVRQYAPQT